jgi:hypothetical protein
LWKCQPPQYLIQMTKFFLVCPWASKHPCVIHVCFNPLPQLQVMRRFVAKY